MVLPQDMPFRQLGQTGLRVSRLSLGTGTFGSRWGPRWSMPALQADALVGLALDRGVNFIDTANVYNGGESELWVGRAINGLRARSRVVVATKFGYRGDARALNSGGASRSSMAASVEKSLTRLGTDYIDLLYLHVWDGVTPVAETLGAAADLRAAGKIRYFGLSNVPGWYLGASDVMADWRGWPRTAALQMHYNLLARTIEGEFLPYLRREGTGFVVWGPLANGLLARPYSIDQRTRTVTGAGRVTEAFGTGDIDPHGPRVEPVIATVKRIACAHGHAPGQVALAWLLAQEPVSSIVLGVTGPDQLEENLGALAVSLTSPELEELNHASQPDSIYPYTFAEPGVLNLVRGPES